MRIEERLTHLKDATYPSQELVDSLRVTISQREHRRQPRRFGWMAAIGATVVVALAVTAIMPQFFRSGKTLLAANLTISNAAPMFSGKPGEELQLVGQTKNGQLLVLTNDGVCIADQGSSVLLVPRGKLQGTSSGSVGQIRYDPDDDRYVYAQDGDVVLYDAVAQTRTVLAKAGKDHRYADPTFAIVSLPSAIPGGAGVPDGSVLATILVHSASSWVPRAMLRVGCDDAADTANTPAVIQDGKDVLVIDAAALRDGADFTDALPQAAEQGSDPTVTSDGGLLISAGASGFSVVNLVSVGTDMRETTIGQSGDTDPGISPDSRFLAYLRNGSELHITDFDLVNGTDLVVGRDCCDFLWDATAGTGSSKYVFYEVLKPVDGQGRWSVVRKQSDGSFDEDAGYLVERYFQALLSGRAAYAQSLWATGAKDTSTAMPEMNLVAYRIAGYDHPFELFKGKLDDAIVQIDLTFASPDMLQQKQLFVDYRTAMEHGKRVIVSSSASPETSATYAVSDQAIQSSEGGTTYDLVQLASLEAQRQSIAGMAVDMAESSVAVAVKSDGNVKIIVAPTAGTSKSLIASLLPAPEIVASLQDATLRNISITEAWDLLVAYTDNAHPTVLHINRYALKEKGFPCAETTDMPLSAFPYYWYGTHKMLLGVTNQDEPSGTRQIYSFSATVSSLAWVSQQ
jgi:hypothetical protein